jgi:hypothetical protein
MRGKKSAFSTLAILLLALEGCGGGSGGGSASAPPPASAEGAYFGTISDGRQHYSLVLENGQIYTLYGSTSNNIFAVNGFVQGDGSSNNGSFSAADVKIAAANGSVTAGSLSASYVAGSSFNGSLTAGANVVTFTGAPIGSSIYNYNAAPNLGAITGSWNLTSLRGYLTTLNIAASGTFTATSSGCQFSGTIKPRSSGKNVLDVSATFGASPCILAGASLSGIAISYALPNGPQELAIALIDQTRTKTSAFFGVR